MAPARDFFDVFNSRRSETGRDIAVNRLGSILQHSTRLRERRADGRFGRWESRSAPSAGGIHRIRLLVLPLSGDLPMGLYCPDKHAIVSLPHAESALRNARSLVKEMGIPERGAFLQFVADQMAYTSRYENAFSLIARDAGALTSVICLVAECLGSKCRPLGHLDKGIVTVGLFDLVSIGIGGVILTA